MNPESNTNPMNPETITLHVVSYDGLNLGFANVRDAATLINLIKKSQLIDHDWIEESPELQLFPEEDLYALFSEREPHLSLEIDQEIEISARKPHLGIPAPSKP